MWFTNVKSYGGKTQQKCHIENITNGSIENIYIIIEDTMILRRYGLDIHHNILGR